MITKNKYYLFFLIGLILFSSDIYSQKTKEPVNRILFVFDASQSMLGRWQSGRKIDISKQLLTNITDSLKDVKNLEIALRVYGHQRSYPPQDCDDTKLEINFLPSEIFADRIKGKLSMIKAKGTTPIARSLEEAASDFPRENSRNIVILLHTEMGNGVDFMMGTHKWHGNAPNDEQLENALSQNIETLGDY